MNNDSLFLEQIIEQLEPLEIHQAERVKDWEKRYLSKQGNNPSHCSYCGIPIAKTPDQDSAKWSVDFLIPIPLGGSNHPKNMVLSCLSCVQVKKGRDWIEWGKSSSIDELEALVKQRIECLDESYNHVLPLLTGARASARKAAQKAFETRWAHPRFKVYASVQLDGGWFALRSINGALRAPFQTRLQLKRIMGGHTAQRSDLKGWRIYQVPFNDFHKIAFQLIELNALIVEVGSSFNPYSISPEYFRRWAIHLKGFEWTQDVVDYTNEVKLVRSSIRSPKEVAEFEKDIRIDSRNRKRSISKSKNKNKDKQFWINDEETLKSKKFNVRNGRGKIHV